MHLSFALFADAANLSQEGKLNILGVFDAVQVSALPAVHPRAQLVLRIKGTRVDVGRHVVGLRWVNPAGHQLWATDADLEVATPPAGLMEMDIPLIAALDLPIDQSGAFAMRIYFDDELRGEVRLTVHSMSSAVGPLPSMGAMGGLLS